VQFVYTPEGIDELRKFCGNSLGLVTKYRHPDAKGIAQIKTFEDHNFFKVMYIATEGDWVIKGVSGEFYAIKPDIFEKTYERVD